MSMPDKLKRLLSNPEAAQHFFEKYSLGHSVMTPGQFNAGLRTIGVVPSNVTQTLFEEYVGSSGMVNIKEFCFGMSSGGAPQSRGGGYGGYQEPMDRPRTAPAASYGGGGQRQQRGFEPPQRGAPPPAAAGGFSLPVAASLSVRKPKETVDFGEICVDKFRKIVLQRGGASGIAGLGRSFRILDRNHDERIDPAEMEVGLQRFGIQMSRGDMRMLLAAVDRDGEGTISYDEFLIAIRGPINERRLKLIDMAFQIMDKTGDGVITVEDLEDRYNTKFDPDVKSGRLSPHEALGGFLQNFDTIERDGVVTKEEWIEYYKGVSASIDNDDYFELMMRNAWHITGGEGWCENTSNLRILVEFTDGTQEVVEIKNDLGLDKNDYQAVERALRQQGCRNFTKFWLYS